MSKLHFPSRVCLDGRKWRERKGRDLEGGRISCLDSKMGEKEFGGEGIERIWWILFVKVTISPKLERYEGKTLISLPFPSIPSYTNKSYFPSISLPFVFLPLPSPSFLPFFSLKNYYPNIVLKSEDMTGLRRETQAKKHNFTRNSFFSKDFSSR